MSNEKFGNIKKLLIQIHYICKSIVFNRNSFHTLNGTRQRHGHLKFVCTRRMVKYNYAQ